MLYEVITLCDDVVVVTFNGLSKAYRACGSFDRRDWASVVHALDLPGVKADEIEQLLAVTERNNFV